MIENLMNQILPDGFNELIVLFFLLDVKYLVDLLQNFRCKFRSDLTCLHIFMDLFHAARSRDHRAHIRIFQTPCECKLRERTTELAGNWLQRLDLCKLLLIRKLILQPVISFESATAPFGNTFVVLT